MRLARFMAPVCALAITASPARATIPVLPWNQTLPPVVRLVGADVAGHPDTLGIFTVVCRDFANNLMPDARIVVDFTAATDLRLCDTQVPGLARVPRGVEGRTDAQGRMRVAILGCAIPGAPPSGPRAIAFYFHDYFQYFRDDYWIMGYASGAAFDLNGSQGVGGADFSLWLKAFVSGASPAVADYDGNGAVGGADLSEWLRAFVMAGSTVTCPAVVSGPQ